MRLRVATWNINSVRVRQDQVRRFVCEHAVDVLCLQEIKCLAEQFPAALLAEAGLPHQAVSGQKGWHGVAIASRRPLESGPTPPLCREGHARCVVARVAGIEIVNLYVPAGGDTPDREANPKFDHKLDFLERLAGWMSERKADEPILLAGDLNVAPGEHDVWNHRFMSKIVSHTPVEVAALRAAQGSLGFVDLVREARPDPERLFTWWSYRAADFRSSNRGLRLDHLWASPALHAAAAPGALGRARIHDEVRGWRQPSDHAPVSADFDL